MTEKQKRFIEYYLVSNNATQSAIQAGYSRRSAGKIGHQLLEKTRIQEEISKRTKEALNNLKLDTDRVLAELASVAFSRITDIVSFDTEGGLSLAENPDLSSLASLEWDSSGGIKKVKLEGKLKALELLGKHLGLFQHSKSRNETSNMSRDREMKRVSKYISDRVKKSSPKNVQ